MGFDTTTLGLLLVLGSITFLVGLKRPFETLATLVLLLPFRDFSIRILNAFTDIPIQTVNSLSRWWFVMILGLLGVWLVRKFIIIFAERKIPKLEWVDILFGSIILVGIVEAFLSPVRSAGITSLRGYLQPLAVFVLARTFLPRTRDQLRLLNAGLMVVGLLLFAVALWQVVGWSEETYSTWGYLTQDGRITGLPLYLGEEFYIRPASTVSGPNELGVLFSIFFFLAISWAIFGSHKTRLAAILFAIAFLTGLAFTFSRSAFLGLIAAGVSYSIFLFKNFRRNFTSLESRKRVRLIWISVSALAILIVVMSSVGTFGHVVQTLKALSEEPHIQESVAALQFIPKHLAGVGMGMVSPKGALSLMQVQSRFHVEGSLFQITLEWGIWGFVLWAMFVVISMWKIWGAWRATEDIQVRIFMSVGFSAWVTALIAFVFLPLMQSVNLMVLLWFLLGLGRELGSANISTI